MLSARVKACIMFGISKRTCISDPLISIVNSYDVMKRVAPLIKDDNIHLICHGDDSPYVPYYADFISVVTTEDKIHLAEVWELDAEELNQIMDNLCTVVENVGKKTDHAMHTKIGFVGIVDANLNDGNKMVENDF